MKNIVFFAFLLISATAFAQQDRFTGNWTVKSREQLSGQEYLNAVASKILIASAGKRLKIDRTSETGNAERPDTLIREEVDLGGALLNSQTLTKRTKSIFASLSPDKRGLSMTIRYSEVGQPDKAAYEVKEDWLLSTGDGTLVVTRYFHSLSDNNDNWSVKATYAKQ